MQRIKWRVNHKQRGGSQKRSMKEIMRKAIKKKKKMIIELLKIYNECIINGN